MSLPAETADLVACQCGVETRQQLPDGRERRSAPLAVGRRWRLLLPRVVLLDPDFPRRSSGSSRRARSEGRRRLRRALAEAAVGAWSLPEADLLRLVGVRGGWPQPWARLTTPDLWFDDVALAVMVHSRTFHGGVLDWEATVAADEDLRAPKIDVVAVTPASIAAELERVLARVDPAYGRAARRPRPAGVVA